MHQYPALAIKVAELPSEAAAKQALDRIQFTIETQEHVDADQITVDLRELES